jgi:hypothetical protein
MTVRRGFRCSYAIYQPAPAHNSSEREARKPNISTLTKSESLSVPAAAAEGFGAPLATALLGFGPEEPESAPPVAGFDSTPSDFPILIGKPGWPPHCPLKKSAKAFWSVAAEQAFGKPSFAALRMAWFLQMQEASAKNTSAANS